MVIEYLGESVALNGFKKKKKKFDTSFIISIGLQTLSINPRYFLREIHFILIAFSLFGLILIKFDHTENKVLTM